MSQALFQRLQRSKSAVALEDNDLMLPGADTIWTEHSERCRHGLLHLMIVVVLLIPARAAPEFGV